MPAGQKLSPDIEDAYFALIRDGHTKAEASRRVGIHPNTATKLHRLRGDPHLNGPATRAKNRQREIGAPIPYEDLCEEAQRAWNDFAYFQRRYLGRVPINWQVKAAELVVQALDSDEESWFDINLAPGVGKTTVFCHDIPAWITVRDRAITGLLGHGIQVKAEQYLRRLKNTLERTTPLQADPRLVRRGDAFDAEATLAGDFGRFKPEKGIWAADQIVVEQFGGVAVAEKEATWQAFGRKGGVVGTRCRFVNWDDLVDPARLGNQESIEDDRKWFTDIAEARLEPGGTFILQGQRLAPNDLHRYALDKMEYPEEQDDLEEDDPGEVGAVQKYKHIIYKAHYEEICEHNHKRSSPAYGEPGGCLLDPHRLSWQRLSSIMLNHTESFRVVYQQEEVDPETVLVRKEWVSGTDGHIGCWDKERDRLEVPSGIALDRCISVVSVDPSPSKFWAILWMLIDPESGQQFLIDLERRGMGANKFLDYNVQKQEYTGYAQQMQIASYDLGIPITHWIIETNAAQTFMIQYDAVQNWQKLHGTRIMRQDTYANKSNKDYGVQTVGGIWERGLVRLPGRNGCMGRIAAEKLVAEVTTYPHSTTDDCLMSFWFIQWHLKELMSYQKRQTEARVQLPRPNWMSERSLDWKHLAGVKDSPIRVSARDRMLLMSSERAS